jgi:hypothetical protein
LEAVAAAVLAVRVAAQFLVALVLAALMQLITNLHLHLHQSVAEVAVADLAVAAVVVAGAL